MLVCWWWWFYSFFYWSFARLTAAVTTTISVILSSNKTQNEDILVLANPSLCGKMAVKMGQDLFVFTNSSGAGVVDRIMNASDTVVCLCVRNWCLYQFRCEGWAHWYYWLGDRKGIRRVKTWCWFVGGNDFTGALHVLQLQLLAPPLSSLAPTELRMKTFLYWLTQICLEKLLLKWGESCLWSQFCQEPVLLTVLWTLRTQWYVCVSETGVCINSGVKAKHIGTKLISHDKISLLLYTSPLCGTVRPTAIRLHGMCIVYVADVKMTSVFMMP